MIPRLAFSLLILLISQHVVNERRPAWKVCWSAEVSPYIIYFMWRVIHHILPLKTALICKCVDVDLVCQTCEGSNEDEFHILFNCQFAIECQKLGAHEVTTMANNLAQDDKFLDFFFTVLSKGRSPQLGA